MDAIDREQTSKTRRTLAQSQALAQARATDRATTTLKSVAPTVSRPPASPTASQPPATLGAAPVSGEHLPVIVPGRVVAPTTPIIPRASGRPALSRTFRFAAVVLCIVGVLVTALVYNVVHR